jgi:hypothetical protein
MFFVHNFHPFQQFSLFLLCQMLLQRLSEIAPNYRIDAPSLFVPFCAEPFVFPAFGEFFYAKCEPCKHTAPACLPFCAATHRVSQKTIVITGIVTLCDRKSNCGAEGR